MGAYKNDMKILIPNSGTLHQVVESMMIRTPPNYIEHQLRILLLLNRNMDYCRPVIIMIKPTPIIGMVMRSHLQAVFASKRINSTLLISAYRKLRAMAVTRPTQIRMWLEVVPYPSSRLF